jgi:hypothetical protein
VTGGTRRSGGGRGVAVESIRYHRHTRQRQHGWSSGEVPEKANQAVGSDQTKTQTKNSTAGNGGPAAATILPHPRPALWALRIRALVQQRALRKPDRRALVQPAAPGRALRAEAREFLVEERRGVVRVVEQPAER